MQYGVRMSRGEKNIFIESCENYYLLRCRGRTSQPQRVVGPLIFQKKIVGAVHRAKSSNVGEMMWPILICCGANGKFSSRFLFLFNHAVPYPPEINANIYENNPGETTHSRGSIRKRGQISVRRHLNNKKSEVWRDFVLVSKDMGMLLSIGPRILQDGGVGHSRPEPKLLYPFLKFGVSDGVRR